MPSNDRRHWVTSPPRGRYLTALALAAGLALAVTAGGPARAAQPGLRLITTINVGSATDGIAVDSQTDTIYAGTYQNGTVSVISGATSQVTATIPIPGRPVAMAINPATGTLYVGNRHHTIYVISEATNQVTATIDTGGYVASIAADPAAGRIYAGGIRNVLVISAASNQILARIGGVPAAAQLAADPATDVIYAAGAVFSGGQRTFAMAAISGASDRVTATMPIDGTLIDMTVNPATDTIYLLHFKGVTPRGLAVINGQTLTMTSDTRLPIDPWGVAADPAANAVYVTIANQNGLNPVNLVLKISGATSKTVARVTAGDSPEAIAVNPATDTVYAGDFDAQTITVLHG